MTSFFTKWWRRLASASTSLASLENCNEAQPLGSSTGPNLSVLRAALEVLGDLYELSEAARGALEYLLRDDGSKTVTASAAAGGSGGESGGRIVGGGVSFLCKYILMGEPRTGIILRS